MDLELLKMAGLSTTGVTLVLIAYRVMKSLQGKKLVSSCCGKRLEMGIDVAPMTPNTTVIENPMKNKKEELSIDIKKENN